MKSNFPILVILLLACTVPAFGQIPKNGLLLNSGGHADLQTLSPVIVDSFNTKAVWYKNKTSAVLQFESLPTPALRNELALHGIQLLDYIPHNAYTASITGVLNYGLLKKWNVQAVTSLSTNQKMHPVLARKIGPDSDAKSNAPLDVQVTFSKAYTLTEVTEALAQNGITIRTSNLSAYRVLTLRLPSKQLEALAALPFITYIQPELPKPQPLNFNSRQSTQATLLNAAAADGGRGLNGEGVVMGIGDDADAHFHADFTGRIINRATSGASPHGTHVHGTAAGAGIVSEQQRGFAAKATIVSQDFNNILAYAPVYVADYGMVLTNNSYGMVSDCSSNGIYDIYSYILDEQAFDMPNLQHVFAAGNSGGSTCAPYPAGFHTVLGSYQSAKNTISVGNADYLGTVTVGSSKGPLTDGRIKPDITAMGYNVNSTAPNNGYRYSNGTSMASPAVTGGLALLYQRYRQLHGNANPPNALMKALLCNGATDKGQPGPDYSYGFGYMNLERSISMLENGYVFLDDCVNGSTNTHTLTVPANTAQLKVMLYWNDPASALVSSQALVNDLDLKVLQPLGTISYPKILNPAPAFVSSAAVEGVDHVNNIEQVVVNNPPAGTYILQVQGAIAQNPTQPYVVVYDVVAAGTHVTYPAAGAILVPGSQANITWESSGTGTFNLQYTTDGSNWNPIATGISNTIRNYIWTVPALASSTAQIRIVENASGTIFTSVPFTILGTPTVSLAATQCEGYISINWTPVANATDYEVMMLRGSEMMPVATLTGTSYILNALSKDSVYWVGVRARINGKAGWRSISVSRQPSSGSCSGSMSDNDLGLQSIVAPVSGRKFTSTQLGSSAVQIVVKNLDDVPVTGFTVQYQINNGAWVFENVSASIPAAGLYSHTFIPLEDFSAIGIYVVRAVVKNDITDGVTRNDTITQTIQHLANTPLGLTTPFVDDMESAADANYTVTTIGLDQANRYDFYPAAYGRLRTFVNSGIALSGNRSLTVDADRQLTTTPYPVQYLIGTYNLSTYHVTANDLRLQFSSLNNASTGADNKVWVRGSDTQPWIEAYGPVVNGTSPSLDIKNLLRTNGQDFSGSFQVRWGVPASGQVSTREVSEGLLLDDVQLYEVFNDMQLLNIVKPFAYACGVSSTAPIVIGIRNSSNATATNVAVRYRINSGAWVYETISSIPANTSGQYTFATRANLSQPGVYTVTAEVGYAGDSYAANNTAQVATYNSALVTSFPYLQDFENGNGGWYSDGYLSSWAYGTPASPKMARAASGTKAWKTKLDGNYNNSEASYLYSPCFNIGGMTKPTLSFSVALDIENCGSVLCDGAWVEYSVDNTNWYNLADLTGSGTNWYAAPLHAWTIENYTAWHVATMKLPTGYSTIRFRFSLRADENVVREGIAIDDVHIYDNTKGIYSGATLSAPITQTASGNSWVHFESGGQLIASILPNNQNLGTTNVQPYIYSGAVRNTADKHYYHNRNITIMPAVRTLSAPATIRMYFLDTETAALINATGCAGCSKPATVYDLGINKFSAATESYENGTLNDNPGKGTYTFLPSANVKKVPFDKGYYAEFEVTSFSEFWLSDAAFNNTTVLPVRLIQFEVAKVENAVLVSWKTASEAGVAGYDIECARSTEAFEKGRFETIGHVSSNNTQAENKYTFRDEEEAKSGVRYYRLRIVDNDGTVHYSDVRTVVFSTVTEWQVFPNPSTGIYFLMFQDAANSTVTIEVNDATGRRILQKNLTASGFLQKAPVDLTGHPAGVYLLHLQCGKNKQTFKIYKK